MVKILPVIMCGGSGTRVWPESRESLPKQFISLVGARSTFQMATEILADSVFETPIIISNQDYRFLVADQLAQIKREARIVLEPVRRDSGPAVAVAAELAALSGPDTIVAVLAADHVVQNRQGFVDLCKQAAEAAALGYIVTLGIKPNAPATGYGYIKTGKQCLAMARFSRSPPSSKSPTQRPRSGTFRRISLELGKLLFPRRCDASRAASIRAAHRGSGR